MTDSLFVCPNPNAEQRQMYAELCEMGFTIALTPEESKAAHPCNGWRNAIDSDQLSYRPRTEQHNMTTQTEVTRQGNLTNTPEPGTSKGTTYARFTVACEQPKDGSNNWKGELATTFYECVVFGSVADNACASLDKGDRVIVVGEPSTGTWTGNDGQERVTKKIAVRLLGADLRFTSVTINRTARTSRTTPRPETNDETF